MADIPRVQAYDMSRKPSDLVQGTLDSLGHSLMSEAALKSEHGVNNYLGNPLGDVQVRIHAFFIFEEAAS